MYKQTIPWKVNYDESEIPPYDLPDLMTCSDGTKVSSAEMWTAKRRPELLKQFRDIMYGNPIPMPDETRFTVVSEKKNARGGLAIRREIRLDFLMKDGRRHSVIVLLYIPSHRRGKVPVFVSLTFGGNQGITDENDIFMTGLQGKRGADFIPPGGNIRRYPIDLILKRGYALAVASYHDFFPDCPDSWGAGIYGLFRSPEELTGRPADASAIAVWAWGYSRILDCVSALPEIDGGKAVCIGHSRLGKASLWAGVSDERFKLVCVNDSGCGGAAPSRRLFGETIYCMYHYSVFGEWWFTDRMKSYAENVDELPFDQHALIALVAPRAVAVHSATEDLWADPRGEYLSAFCAGEVFRMFGKEPLASPEPPGADEAVGTDVSYFLRTGPHDILLPDWEHYLDDADRVFGK